MDKALKRTKRSVSLTRAFRPSYPSPYTLSPTVFSGGAARETRGLGPTSGQVQKRQKDKVKVLK